MCIYVNVFFNVDQCQSVWHLSIQLLISLYNTLCINVLHPFLPFVTYSPHSSPFYAGFHAECYCSNRMFFMVLLLPSVAAVATASSLHFQKFRLFSFIRMSSISKCVSIYIQTLYNSYSMKISVIGLRCTVGNRASGSICIYMLVYSLRPSYCPHSFE